MIALKRGDNSKFFFKYTQFTWNITRFCNYDCAYCGPDIHDKVSKRPDLETLKRIANRIFEYKPPEEIYFSITGGEPTAMTDFLPFMRWLHEQNIGMVGFVTNGSRNLEYYKEIANYVRFITYSYHPEDLPEDKDDEFIRKVLETREILGKGIRINMMVDPRYRERVRRVTKILQDNDVFIAIRRIDGSKHIIHYTEEDREWMIANTPVRNIGPLGKALLADGTEADVISSDDLIIKGYHDFRGWYCYIGVEYFYIDFEGDMWRGTCFQGGKLGNIYEDNMVFPGEPVLCGKATCTCNGEVLARKTKDLDKGKVWLFSNND